MMFNNTSLQDPVIKNTAEENVQKIAMISLYGIIGCVSFFSNSFIFLVVGFSKKLWSNSYLLLVSLAATDWLIIIVGIPVHIVNIYYGETITKGAWCNIYGYLIQTVFQCSMFNLSLIAFHRYTLYVKKKWYQKMFGGKKIFIVLFSFAWLLPMAISSTPFYGLGRFYDDRSRNHCMIDWLHDVYYIIYIQLLVFPPNLVLMSFCYIRIVQKTKQRLRAITNDSRMKKKHKTELHSTYMLLVVLLTSGLCFSPYMVLIFVEFFSGKRLSQLYGFISMFFCYSNSMFDFLIYNAMNKRFRRCFQKIMRTFLRRLQGKPKVRPLEIEVKFTAARTIGETAARSISTDDKNLRTFNGSSNHLIKSKLSTEPSFPVSASTCSQDQINPKCALEKKVWYT